MAALWWLPLQAQDGWEGSELQPRYDSLMQLAAQYPDDSLARKSYLLHQAGNTADDAGQTSLAIERTAEALSLRLTNEALLADEVLVSAINLGIYHTRLEQYADALRFFGMVTSRAPNRKEAVAWYQTGRIYGQTGQFAEGEQAFRRAAELPAFADSPYLTAYLQQQVGALNLKRNNAAGGEAAIPYLQQALAYFVADEDDYGLMETRNFLGWAYAETGNYDRAVRELQQAVALAEKLNEPETLALAHSNMGLALRRQGNSTGAIAAYHRALDIDMPSAKRAVVFNNLSTALLEARRPQQALQYAQLALQAAIPDYEANRTTDLPRLVDVVSDRPGVLLYLTDLARAHRALAGTGNTVHARAALEAFRRADGLLDVMRRRQLLEDTRTYWRADARALYDEAISAALATESTEAVFYFMEKSRARLLLDEVSAGRAENLLPQGVRRRLGAMSRSVRTHPEEPESLRRFSQLQDSVLAAFPGYARERIGPDPPPRADLPGILNGDYLVEYYVSGQMTLALVVYPDGTLKTVKLAAPSVWEPILWAYRAQLTNPATRPNPKLGRELCRQLFDPLQLPQGADLIVIPDGELYLLPFGTLLQSLPDEQAALTDWPWLGQDYKTRYAYSTQLLALAEEQRGRGNGRVLALAPVAETEGDEAGLELPATYRTVRHLAGLFPADTLINAMASRNAFREKADAYSLLHLGTHAYSGNEGGFLLRGEPALYTRADLLEHRLRADLVVIGACETGLGERLVGEGVASLGRGFARRGAPGIIMSLWSVDDGATAELLNSTYTGLAAGLGPATALRAAGKAYRGNGTNPRFNHPYYWAGLVYYGRDEALPMVGNSVSWLTWLAVTGGAILLVILVVRRRQFTG